jgi:hypothetical protein
MERLMVAHAQTLLLAGYERIEDVLAKRRIHAGSGIAHFNIDQVRIEGCP